MSELKVGMIGLDTSHVSAFVQLLNDPSNEFHVPGVRIVKAFPGGSAKFSLSANRVEGFTNELKEAGIEIVDSLEALAGLDAYFLESVDGDQHLEQFKVLANFGKPVYIDKPLACSYAEAKEIVELAKAKNVPLMSCSSIRYALGINDLKKEEDTEIFACQAFGPMNLLDDYRDYFWYGIHSTEIVFAMLGKGCESVQVIPTKHADLLLGKWADGKVGSILGNRNGVWEFGCTITTNTHQRQAIASGAVPYYSMLLKEVVPFFQTGKSPLDIEETLDIIAFLEAASRSRAANGAEIKIADL
ncbi:MAG: gfo/Idh/MocA family oxidoreductase [Lentisphaerae bacterium]|nr:gfo/Idh/MocA family oxidoreductase [Lentisphaerota bacterium]